MNDSYQRQAHNHHFLSNALDSFMRLLDGGCLRAPSVSRSLLYQFKLNLPVLVV